LSSRTLTSHIMMLRSSNTRDHKNLKQTSSPDPPFLKSHSEQLADANL
jgi:hypothetical protein